MPEEAESAETKRYERFFASPGAAQTDALFSPKRISRILMKIVRPCCIGSSSVPTGRSLTGANRDWLPENIAALLAHPDLGLRSAAQKEAQRLAQKIVDHAYNERLLELVGRTLPPGIAISDYPGLIRSSAELPLSWVNLSWEALREGGKETAERNAAAEVQWLIYSWAFNNAKSCADHGDDFGAYVQMLVAALNELHSANDASASVMVWMRLRVAGPPADWRAVQALLRGNDNLMATVCVPF